MIKTVQKVDINDVQTSYGPAKIIETIYCQANVTSQLMGVITQTTLGNVKGHDLKFEERANGVLVTNSKGSMLVPYTNIRNIVYK